MGNAIKFTEKGDVAIQVNSFALGMNGGLVRVRLEVRDTGIGIPKGAIAGIFEAFRQVDDATNRRFEGTGLGLSIVRQLVTLMGGKIEVESEVGRGSLFCVDITFAVLQPPVITAQRFSTTFPGKRALIVDDSAASRKLIERYLSNLRIVSTSVASGDAALRALEQAHRSGEPYDLAIIDAVMPEMSGVELAQRVRADAATASLPVVMLTSLEQAVVSAADAATGDFPSLTKPVREAEFCPANHRCPVAAFCHACQILVDDRGRCVQRRRRNAAGAQSARPGRRGQPGQSGNRARAPDVVRLPG